MRIVVTGSRDWHDTFLAETVLDGFAEQAAKLDELLYVIEGGARGLDTIARRWAKRQIDVEPVTVKAEWRKYGLAAGPIRNRKMLDEYEADYVVAFHDALDTESKGTADCVSYAKEKGIPVFLVSHP